MRVRGAIIFAMTFAVAVHAADELEQASAVGARRGAFVLEEVTVTAQKRAELLQETPIAITAITADVIENLKIISIADIGMLVPGFSFSQDVLGTRGGMVSIRGVATPSDPQGTLDSTIGMYIDGVYLARPAFMVADLADLERIEVLRGPQGTLFGRNTTGGAVNLITRAPSDRFELTQAVGFGNFSGLSSRTTLHTGDLFGGVLRASLAYMHGQRDGSVDNIDASSSHDPGAFRNNAGRLALRLLPTEHLTIDYAFDWTHTRNVPGAFQLFAAAPHVTDYLQSSPAFGGDAAVISTHRQDRLALGGRSLPVADRLTAHTLIASMEFKWAALKSVTAYRENDHDTPGHNLDGIGDRILGLTLDPETFDFAGLAPIHMYGGYDASERHRQFQQELTLLSSGTGSWEWAAGAFYFEESTTSRDPQLFTFVLPPSPPDLPMSIGLPLSSTTTYESEAKSAALYGQLGYRPAALGERLGITAGVRYSRDKRSLLQTQPYVNDGEATFSEPTGHVSLDYRFTPDLNGYLRLSHGYRSGGFNVRSFQRAFDPETIDQLELGVKSDWLQKRLRVNAAIYASRYQDQQINRFDTDLGGGAATIIENAGKSEYIGGELELTAMPLNGLLVTAGFGYVDIKIKEVRAADGSNIAHQYRVANTPGTTAQAAIEYSFPFTLGGKLAARLDWSHEAGFYFFARDDDNPFNEQIKREATDRVNAQLRWDDLDLGASRWRLSTSLWVKNLTDEIYRARAIDFGALGFAGVVFSEPRTYGADFTLRF